jgi:CBS domain-containing protein
METSAIHYRVADFLKKHPPFHTMSDDDLLALTANGRVRFHEPGDYLLWQGEPHRSQVFVIQQGTVSLWHETSENAELRDVRGAGDMLGLERFNGAPACQYSARSESDVIVYAFAVHDFEALLDAYPHALDYVRAEGRLTVDYRSTGDRRDVTGAFLQQVVTHKTVLACMAEDSAADAARQLRDSGADALAVLDADRHVRGVVTAASFVRWAAATASAEPGSTVTAADLMHREPYVVGPTTSLTDGALALARSGAPAIVITDDGSPGGRLTALVTERDLAASFGEQPSALMDQIRSASAVSTLRDLNHRVRAFALQHLTSAAAVDWVAQFTHLCDVGIVTRLLALTGGDAVDACWCFCGSSGRAESLTRLSPQVIAIARGRWQERPALEAHERLLAALFECDYLPRATLPFEPPFYVATDNTWAGRFLGWLTDPIRTEMYRSRTLFDLRPVRGDVSLWESLDGVVRGAIDTDFLEIIANDCLATLPPLTFFHDAVVDKSGEQTDVFHLEESALRPLVDVGRVFGMAARAVLGQSTFARFATARTLLPEQHTLFAEAADTLRVVLWQQGRIGISQGTSAIDLPPSLLSRHDRHVLKSGFRSILRLLQFTADPSWITTL